VKGSDPVEMISLPDAADDPGEPDRYSPEALARFAEMSREIRLLRRHAGEPLPELIGRILHVTGLETEVSLADPAIAEQQQFALSTFMSLASTFGEAEGEFTLGAFLMRLRDLERFDVDLRMDVASRSHQVQLMTVHKSKGLEFEHVFVPFVSAGSFPSANGRPAWISNADVVPWPLREDSTDELCSYPNGCNSPKAKEQTAYKKELRAIEDLESQRLAYVAFTRAEYSLTVTGHWWGPTQIKPRGPSRFLESVHEACEGGNGEIITWAPKPGDEAENPALGVTAVAWPPARDPERQAALLSSMQVVRSARPSASIPPGMGSSDLERVTRWDAQIDSLIAELAARDAAEITVRAPESMSASALMRALTDPEGLAVDILRPMPSAPAPQARRGTDFHAWVETRFGQQSLLDPDDLPGAADHEIVSDEALADLKAAFESSEFAHREPVAIERPFSLVLGGRVVRGRIDAVFADGDRFDVIDWKTGAGRGLDPMQLAIYRLAWSQLEGVPIERIDAAFYLVSQSRLIRPESFPDLQALLDPR
jgi:DNA helicase-2/ATP-dependent DNA helicase PcrA